MLKGEYQLIIKEIKIQDFIEYKSIILDLLIETYYSNFDISLEQSVNISKEKINIIPKYLEQGNTILMGAFVDKKLIGFIWLYIHNYFDEQRIHINQIIVSQNYRSKGIGKKLIKEVESIAKKHKIKTIDLFVSEINQNAINFYESLNFTTERRYMKKVLLEDKNVDCN